MNKFSQIITREGFHKLSADLLVLQKEKRPKAVDRLKKAREMGDLSENSEYVAAKEELNMVDSRIFELEMMLRNSQIKDKSKDASKVGIGDVVYIEGEGIREKYSIVGEAEINMKENKISHKSPIGKALLGKSKGETVEINTPNGAIVYKIVDIN